jgi:hypothetical protein
MNNKLPEQIINFLIYVSLQVLIVKNMVLFDIAFSYIYIAFLLLLPFDTSKLSLLFLGFTTGFVVDIFYDSLGINAAASVLMMYIRPYWLYLVASRESEENIYNPGLRNIGFEAFITYIFPLIFIHHFTLFFLDAGGFHMFFYVSGKVIFSTLLTGSLIIVLQFLFYPKRRTI